MTKFGATLLAAASAAALWAAAGRVAEQAWERRSSLVVGGESGQHERLFEVEAGSPPAAREGRELGVAVGARQCAYLEVQRSVGCAGDAFGAFGAIG